MQKLYEEIAEAESVMAPPPNGETQVSQAPPIVPIVVPPPPVTRVNVQSRAAEIGKREAEKIIKAEATKAAKEAIRDERANVGAAGSSRPYFRKTELDQFIPNTDRVKIGRRGDMGNIVHIRDYRLHELHKSRDIETFLQEYLVPRYGEGEYEIELVDATNKVIRTSSVYVVDPRGSYAKPAAPDQSTEMVRLLMNRLETMEQQNRPKSIGEQLAEMEAAKKAFGGGSDPMLLMMLMQKQQPDPGLGEIKSLLRDVLAAQHATPPPMPMLPQAPDPAHTMMEMMRTITEMVKPAQPVQQFSWRDLLAALPVALPLIQKVTGHDAMEAMADEMAELRQANARLQEQNGLKNMMEHMKEFREVSEFFRPPEGSTFADALRTIFSGPALANVGALIDKATAYKQVQQGQQPQGEEDPEITIPERPPQPRIATDKPKPSKPKPAPLKPEVISKFKTQVKAIELATTDGERVTAALTAFQLSEEIPAWKGVAEKVFKLAEQGKRDDVIEIFGAFLNGVSEAGLLAKDAADATLKLIVEHYDTILAAVVGGG